MLQNKGKILIISGDMHCFNALNDFGESIASELTKHGYEPVIKSITTLNKDILDDLMNPEYHAIIGFQSNLFTIEISDGIYVGNLIPAPKYDYMFDPPATRRAYFEPHIEGLTYLYHDRGYVEYVRKYFPHVSVIMQPPGGGVLGMEDNEKAFEKSEMGKSLYDCTFLGTYTDYRTVLRDFTDQAPNLANMIISFFEYLIKNPNIAAEEGFIRFLDDNKINYDSSKIPSIFEAMYAAENAARAFYRENIISTIINAGIKTDLFSKTWYNSPFKDNPNVTIHEEVRYRESMDIMASSKLSLNIFSWHKDTMTERVANIMLNGSVCVTDSSVLLKELFTDNEDIIIYDLENYADLPERMKFLLRNDELRNRIARAGYQNAAANHKWSNRVDELVQLLR